LYLAFTQQVKEILAEAIEKAGFETEDIVLEPSQHADLSSRIAFRLAAGTRQNPKEIADRIVAEIAVSEHSLVGDVRATGPYINFHAADAYLYETYHAVRRDRENFGGHFLNDRVLLEHTSANPNGPLHVGHIRNSILGDCLARILRKAGCEVEVQYYINDMGRQIAIVSWAFDHFDFNTGKKSDHAIADIYIQANAALEADPAKVAEIDRLMQLVETGDEATIQRFDKAVGFAVQGIKQTLLGLNVHHDAFVSESSFVRSGAVEDTVERIRQTGRTDIDDGATVVDLSDYGFEKTLVIQRSDGTSLYTTRDLAYHEWKATRAERIIDVLGADHKLISGQLKATLDAIGVQQPEIVIFEFVSLPEGSMSTRRGKFISADDLLEQVEVRAFEEVDRRRPEMEESFKKMVARMVGIGAMRYDIVKVSPEKSTVFDWKEALDFEKQGAPFIQYSHARACSILKKAEEEGLWNPDATPDPSLLADESETTLIRKMALFDQVLEKCAAELRPHHLAIYGRELADAFNQFYRFSPVLAAEDGELRQARLGLVDCAKVVIASVLDTLGIDAPQSM
jgi:arginyl-tRNA synthetase